MTTKRDKLLGELVVVNWLDSCGGNDWLSDHEIPSINVSSNLTAGYLVHRDARQVKIAQSRSVTSGVKPWGAVIAIPRFAVRKLTHVKKVVG